MNIQNFLRGRLTEIAWTLSALVTVIGFVAWAQNLNWELASIGAYEIFPFLGLLTFSLMWVHYMISGIRSGFNLEKVKLNKWYFKITAAIVLFGLFLHPGLLIGQLFLDGFGLPPQSYLTHYVAPGLGWAVYLGTIGWMAFMAFELRRWYGKKPWWKYVLYANDIAIWAIFIHGLKLGADVGAPWLVYVWYVYGVLLAAAFCAIYYKKWFAKTSV
jgi:hypothetical protein